MTAYPNNLQLPGGVLCLDFVDTKNWADGRKPYDFFTNYEALLQWSLHLGLVTPPQAGTLSDWAAQQPAQAGSALERVMELRQVIYRIFYALAHGQEVSAKDLEYFNDAWVRALAHLKVAPQQGTFRWTWVPDDRALDCMLWPVLQSAAELLVSEKINRVKSCGGCGWLFLDTTKSGRRRWCDMRICGNRAKSRRHYARGRGAGTG